MSNKGKETKVVTNLDNHTDEMMERFKYRNCGSCQFFCIYFFKTVDGEQGCVDGQCEYDPHDKAFPCRVDVNCYCSKYQKVNDGMLRRQRLVGEDAEAKVYKETGKLTYFEDK